MAPVICSGRDNSSTSLCVQAVDLSLLDSLATISHIMHMAKGS